jgi:HSP20 family protein
MADTNLAKRPEVSPQLAGRQRQTFSPSIDVYENDDDLLLVADVPGASPEGIDVQLEDGKVTIRATRAADVAGTPLSTERRTHDYLRVFSVPHGVDATKIDAQLTAGVLRLRIPKPASLKPRRIEVRQG